jgi:hypothetical protein
MLGFGLKGVDFTYLISSSVIIPKPPNSLRKLPFGVPKIQTAASKIGRAN